jgi:AcrR family transcriptional regulator
LSSGFRDRPRDAQARQQPNQDERLRAKHEQWQLDLESRIQAMHDRIHSQPPARGTARELLIAEATDRFQARGFADVSMQEIANAVGVTKAAMYYHFQSKEALFEVVIERAVNTFWEGIIARAHADGPLRDVLRGIIAYVKGSLEGFSLRLMDDFKRHCSPEAHQRILTQHPTPGRELATLFDRAIAAGEMRPLNTAVVAVLFLGMVMSLGHQGHTHREPQPGDDDILLDISLHGIATTPPS